MTDFDRIVAMLEAAPKKLDYDIANLVGGGKSIAVNEGYHFFYSWFTFDKNGKFISVEAYE